MLQPNPQALFLADLSPKSKDQRVALTSATTAPDRRGGEAHICCLNTDRGHHFNAQQMGVKSWLAPGCTAKLTM